MITNLATQLCLPHTDCHHDFEYLHEAHQCHSHTGQLWILSLEINKCLYDCLSDDKHLPDEKVRLLRTVACFKKGGIVIKPSQYNNNRVVSTYTDPPFNSRSDHPHSGNIIGLDVFISLLITALSHSNRRSLGSPRSAPRLGRRAERACYSIQSSNPCYLPISCLGFPRPQLFIILCYS